MQHTKEYLEDKYAKKMDPWGYATTPMDMVRKANILGSMMEHGPYTRALDIGAGEGWISKDLDAIEIHGIELSDNAAARFPENVKRVHEPEGLYDLVLLTGVLYDHYDVQKFYEWVEDAEPRVLITCNIYEHEVLPWPWIADQTFTFAYNSRARQILRVYHDYLPFDKR